MGRSLTAKEKELKEIVGANVKRLRLSALVNKNWTRN